MQKFTSVNELVNTLKPDDPVYCVRPNSVKKSVEFFKNNFPGKVLYAVKTNPNEKIIKIIINSGIQNFDVASINEVKLIRKIDNKVKIYSRTNLLGKILFDICHKAVSSIKKAPFGILTPAFTASELMINPHPLNLCLGNVTISKSSTLSLNSFISSIVIV